MEPLDEALAAAVWQRVRQGGITSFRDMADRETEIIHICQALYHRGDRRRLMDQLCRQAQHRRAVAEGMARRAGEQEHHRPRGPAAASPGRLVDLLGQAAWAYDPGHPDYGPAFARLREECAEAQRRLLGQYR